MRRRPKPRLKLPKRPAIGVPQSGQVPDAPACASMRHDRSSYQSRSISGAWQLGQQVVPPSTSAAEVMAMNPDGIFLSNGPGDPASMNREVEQIRELLKAEKPMFGICFGHQLLGRAFGGQTFKLVFGHRGGNQPVKEVAGKGVEITSHNHGFAVQAESLPPDVEVTHINLNDQCVEGMRHRTLPVISVQYHPEAAPGPHDAEHHFQRFVELMAQAQR